MVICLAKSVYIPELFCVPQRGSLLPWRRSSICSIPEQCGSLISLSSTVVDHSCKLITIHVEILTKSATHLPLKFLAVFFTHAHELSTLRYWLAIGRNLSFHSSTFWLAPKVFYCNLLSYLLTHTTTIYLLRTCTVDTKTWNVPTFNATLNFEVEGLQNVPSPRMVIVFTRGRERK